MIIDFVAVLLIAYGFYLGYSKGLIKTVFAAVSIIIALVAVLKLSHHVIDFLKAVLPIDERISHMIGFVLTFILVLAIIRFIGNKIEALMKSIHIGGVNKILGGSVLGLIYAGFGWNLYRKNDRKSAVQLMFSSFIYLPLALIVLWLDKI